MANGKTSTWNVHYNEIGLKGKNRTFFEKQLVRNIGANFSKKKIKLLSAQRLWGKIILKTTQTASVKSVLKNTFGIAWSARAVPSSFAKIEETIQKLAGREKFSTFAIRSKINTQSARANDITNQQLEIRLGDMVRKKFSKKVDLTSPDTTFFIESGEDDTLLVYTKKIPGLDGLPVGSGGKALCLLSGGIDSPVAGYKIISRGVVNSFVHFHSYPQTSVQSINKVKKLVKILKKYQPQKTQLFLTPILEAQKEIYLKIDKRYLVLVYRRLMLKLAQEIALGQGCQAIITGDSLGQVASQTIENIAVQNEAATLPILRPLIGMDKNKIIAIGKQIAAYPISILPHQDCCSLFLPAHPITRGSIEAVKREEEKFAGERLIENCLQKTEKIHF